MNYSILERNVLDSLEHEEAKSAFLRATTLPKNDRYSYAAEAIAREVDKLCSLLKPAVGFAAKPFQANNEVQSDLLAFILRRHWQNRVATANG